MISRRNGRPAADARVAIIGCGFSGIAAAVALQRRGIHDFVILEARDGIGGTWLSNRYPGAEVDLESHIYSFSYAPGDWTRTHASRNELREYLQRVADTHGVTPKVRFGVKVEKVAWDDVGAHWVVHTGSGSELGPFTAVISAVGFLNIPIIPPFARGNSGFRGTVCHTSRWPDGLDLTGKAVGIVGTGSSGVQVAPAAEKVASSVKIFQREPNWMVPKKARDFTPLERRSNRTPVVHALRRWWLFWRYDLRQFLGRHVVEGTRVHRRRTALARRHLERSLAGRADLQALVTPTHVFEGKRVVLSDDYYPMLRSPKVTVVPHGVTELTTNGVRDSEGREHVLDVVVLATGFDASNYLGNLAVVGAGGIELHDHWQGEPEALLGVMVPGFPNFFMMYGPNTNSVPLVSFYEAQARFAAGLIARMTKNGWRRVEVRERAHRLYNDLLQARLRKTVWTQAQSYFRAGTGKIVTQWPFSASRYIVSLELAARIAVRFADRRPAIADKRDPAMAPDLRGATSSWSTPSAP
jgi:cation diffusion facilitator CzcD-associated flavoprotein CzcO